MKRNNPAICGYSLVSHGTPDDFFNYDGSPLRRCSGCRGIHYIDKDAQKVHWKTHKKYCRTITASEMAAISSSDLETCDAKLGGNFEIYHSGGPELYQYMKRLRVLYNDKNVDGRPESAFTLHTIGRSLIFHPPSNIVLGMAASPNMARLLFGNEEDLLNEKTRLLKYQCAKYNGLLPSMDFIDAMDDPDEKKLLQKLHEKYDELDYSFYGEPSSMSYCYLYFNLIVACAIHGHSSRSSINDGIGTLRGGDPRRKSAETLLATAALRRALTLWTDKHVLTSCGDAMAPAASLALTAIKSYQEIGILCGVTCRKNELVPGLSVDCAIMTCMSELLEGAGSNQYSAKLLKLLGQYDGATAPWTDLPVERRAKVVMALVHYVMEGGGDDRGFEGGVEMPADAVNAIFHAICSTQNTEITKSVLDKAATDGEYIGPEGCGMNSETRAFIYFLVRKNLSIDEWKSLHVVDLVKEFSDIPPIHRAPNDAIAKEKDECLRLARGDKIHAEINAIFSK